MGIKGADLKNESLLYVLGFCGCLWYPDFGERPQIDMCSLEWVGRLKCRATGFDASLSSFSTSRRCSRNRSPSRLPVSPMYSFLHNVQVMQ